jgi:hypothetical protein
MKKVLPVAVFLSCFFVFSTLAQTKTSKTTTESTLSNPVSTTRKTPAGEENPRLWNEYSSEKFGFWIQFPASKDQVSSDDSDEFVNFETVNGKAHYALSVKKLLAALSNRELDEMFDSIVSATEDETTRLISQKDVYLNGVLGRELVYEEESQIVFGRFYILESKIFMLTVTLPKKDYNRGFDRLARKFFDSFGVRVNRRMDA